MKKLTLALFAASLMGATAVHAEAPATKALVVNQQTVLDKATAAVELKKDMEAKRKEFQGEMAKFEQELRKKEQELGAEQAKLSEKEFAKKRAEFEKRIVDVQGRLELRRAQLEDGYNDASKKVFDAMIKAAEAVKTEEKASMLINVDQLLVADLSLDVSDRIIEKLNKELPKVAVTFKSDAEIKKLISASK